MSDKKRMLEIELTTKELLNGEVFFTTQKSVAKENNIFNEKNDYKTMNIILGERELFPKVEEKVKGLKKGESLEVVLNAKDAFGERQSELVRVVPLKHFTDNKINPVPGLVIDADGYSGRVQSVSGGRVRVDFNTPLAGRDIQYNISLVKEVTDVEVVAEEIFKKYYSKIKDVEHKINKTNKELYITVPVGVLSGIKEINKAVEKIAKDFGLKLKIEEKKKVVAKK